jgi:hypothetical protein
MDPDTDLDPAIFVSDLQDVKKFFLLITFLFYLLFLLNNRRIRIHISD